MFKRIPRPNMEELQEALRRAEGILPADVYKLFQDIVNSYASLVNLLSDETMTVGRLRKMLRRGRRRPNAADIDQDRMEETPSPGESQSPVDA